MDSIQGSWVGQTIFELWAWQHVSLMSGAGRPDAGRTRPMGWGSKIN